MIDKRKMDGSKTLWHMDRVIAHFNEGKRIAPVHIDMGIAKFCNIGCVFCYGNSQVPQKRLIERETLLQTMREAGEIGVRSIAIIGDGEPTCNPAYYDALYEGKKAGLSLSTSTNGVLLDTPERRKAILENTEWMRFCFSAGTREGYKKIHQADKFDKVVRNIEAMVNEKERGNYKCDVGMQAVFVPTLMAKEMVEESKLAKKLGVDYFLIKQCSLPEENKAVGMMKFDLNDYDKPEVIAALEECEAMSDSKTQIIPKWNTMKLKGKKPYKHCLAIPLLSEISGNGDFYPCGYFFGDKSEFEKYKFGNLHETSLKEIINSEKYWKIIHELRHKFNTQTQCKGSCRQDHLNIFLDDYLNKPQGINFI